MSRLSDAKLARHIAKYLAHLQELLIESRDSGRTQDQSIIPQVSIDHDELRELTGRTRIKVAFIRNLVDCLENEELDVLYNSENEVLHVRKPPEQLENTYTSFRSLKAKVDELYT